MYEFNYDKFSISNCDKEAYNNYEQWDMRSWQDWLNAEYNGIEVDRYKTDAISKNMENSKFHIVKIINGCWNDREAGTSSTWRELEAIRRIIKDCSEFFINREVIWNTDCKNLLYIMNKGSKIPELNERACQIAMFCRKNNLELVLNWINRKFNYIADYLSRCYDSDDWSISKWFFEILDSKLGPFTIDRFASNYNSKCARFNARWNCPESEAINALVQSWDYDNNWVVPPPRLINQVLDKIGSTRGQGVLMVPQWESAPFWPKLLELEKQRCLREVMTISQTKIIEVGRGDNGIFGSACEFMMRVYKFSNE